MARYFRNHIFHAGFTLIELLIVMAVIGAIVGLALVAIDPVKQMGRGRDAQRKQDLRAISKAVEEYYVVNGSYPTSGNFWCNTSGLGTYSSTWNVNCNTHPLQRLLNGGFLTILPIDPRDLQTGGVCAASGNAGYGYLYRSNGTDYKILAHCTPEGTPLSSTDPFRDPVRPANSWSKYSSGASTW